MLTTLTLSGLVQCHDYNLLTKSPRFKKFLIHITNTLNDPTNTKKNFFS
jgi:hypothetical protein